MFGVYVQISQHVIRPCVHTAFSNSVEFESEIFVADISKRLSTTFMSTTLQINVKWLFETNFKPQAQLLTSLKDILYK